MRPSLVATALCLLILPLYAHAGGNAERLVLQAGPPELELDEPVPNLSDERLGERLFVLRLEERSDASALDVLRFSIDGGVGNADLYVRYGNVPTIGTYDCRPFEFDNEEACDFVDPAVGNWYVMIRARSSYAGVTLLAELEERVTPIELGEPVPNLSDSESGERLFMVTLEEGSSGASTGPPVPNTLRFSTTGGSGDADLYVRYGGLPTVGPPSFRGCRSATPGNEEVCEVPNPDAGNWYVMIRAESAYSGVTLLADLAITCTRSGSDSFGDPPDETAPWCVLQLPAVQNTTFIDVLWYAPTFGDAVTLESASVGSLGGSCNIEDNGRQVNGEMYRITLSLQAAAGVSGGDVRMLQHASLYGAKSAVIDGSLVSLDAGSKVAFDVCATLGDDTEMILETAFVDQQARMSRFKAVTIDADTRPASAVTGSPITSNVQGAVLDHYRVARFEFPDSTFFGPVPPYLTSFIDYETEIVGGQGEFYDYRVDAVYDDETVVLGSRDGTEFSTFEGNPIFARTNVPTMREASGAIWGDCDGDGDDDLFVPRGQYNENLLFRNEGGTLVRENGFDNRQENTQGAAWGDYNNDGVLDLIVTNTGSPSILYKGEGNCLFSIPNVPSLQTPRRSKNPSWADYDNDGDLDLFVANWAELNTLLRNEGEGNNGEVQFTPMTAGEVGAWMDDNEQSWGGYWADYDNDGDLDLFVTNLIDAEPNRLYKNQLVEEGQACFESVESGTATSDQGRSLSASWGDYDNDGDLDLFVANESSPANPQSLNWLYENRGTGEEFALQPSSAAGPVATEEGRSNSSAWQDVDNDGYLDLYTNQLIAGRPGISIKPVLFQNNGGQNFEKEESGNATEYASGLRGAAFADVDRNGYADLFLADVAPKPSSSYVSRFDSTMNNWIRIELDGQESNRLGIGAKVRVEANGMTQMREVTSLSGAGGQNSLVLTFGIGNASEAERVTVEWPSKYQNDLTSVAAGTTETIRETDGVLIPVELTQFDVQVTGRTALLRWQTASETHNAGFVVEHRTPASDAFAEQAFVEGHGTTTEPQQYTHRLEDLEYGLHSFRLKQIDVDGAAEYSPEVEATVRLRERLVVEPIYPNPARPGATLRFAVRERQEVRIDVYDAAGRQVQTVYRGEPAANQMQTVALNTSRLASGLYLVRLKGKNLNAVQKLTVVR